MTRRLTGSIVVCGVAAAFAAGALLVEPVGGSPSAAASDVPAAANPSARTGGYGGKTAGNGNPAGSQAPAPGGRTTGAAAPVTLSISGFAFGQVTAAPGADVTVVNRDGEDHTVTADGKAFNVTVAGGGQGRLVAPTKPGTYTFFCAIHPSMQGRLVVR
jgi:plastocyanin